LLRGIFRTKNLDDILATIGGPQFALRRTLGAFNVTLIGVGAIIGAGIFATVGSAAAGDSTVGRPGAGPSLMLSFVITAVVCGFTALCYAELASMVPISGSAYTYSYATMGELIAWIIGWDLIIEYAIGNVAVAISWAEYFYKLLLNLGIPFPRWLATDYRSASLLATEDPAKYAELFGAAPHIFGVPLIFNFLALAIVALITVVLVWGIRESANFNAGMVLVKVLVLLFFVGAAIYFMSPSAPSNRRGGAARSRGRHWSSSLTSVSMPSRPWRKRRRTRRAICPSGSSLRSSSVPFSTSLSPQSSRASFLSLSYRKSPLRGRQRL
jgi:APA family basic amino acid/polyamine antiporter